MSGFLCNPRGLHCGGEEEGRQKQSAAGGESCIAGFFYGAVIQWKLDIRSRSLLVTCYIVPLLFLFVYGRYFYFCYAGNEKYTDTDYDCYECFHGCVHWASAISDRNVWKRCEKSL